jgi:hypothetical protein
MCPCFDAPSSFERKKENKRKEKNRKEVKKR